MEKVSVYSINSNTITRTQTKTDKNFRPESIKCFTSEGNSKKGTKKGENEEKMKKFHCAFL